MSAACPLSVHTARCASDEEGAKRHLARGETYEGGVVGVVGVAELDSQLNSFGTIAHHGGTVCKTVLTVL